MVESRSQEEMLRLQWAVCPGGWFSLHDVCRCLMLESRSQEEVLRLLWAVCPAGGWQTWNLSNLLQSLEVGSVYMMSSLENKCTIFPSMA